MFRSAEFNKNKQKALAEISMRAVFILVLQGGTCHPCAACCTPAPDSKGDGGCFVRGKTCNRKTLAEALKAKQPQVGALLTVLNKASITSGGDLQTSQENLPKVLVGLC